MNLPALAVRYRPIVFSATLLLMAWGAITYFTIPRREDPEFTIRVCVVSTQWPGAPAEKVEELITDKIEQQVISIEEVDHIRSTTQTGQSIVFVELDDRVPPAEIQAVWDKVRTRVETIQMPEESIKPYVNDEFGDTSVLVLAIHQVASRGRDTVRPEDEYSLRELERFAEDIQDELRLLPGIAKVEMFGVRDEAIFIETDLANWSQLNLTTQQLERLASDRNIIQPGGEIDTPGGHFSVKPAGEFNAINEINQIASVVKTEEGGNSVYLTDLGLSVRRAYEDPANYYCRFGDTKQTSPAVTLGITMKSGSNIIEICDAVKQRTHELSEIEKRLPPDIAVTPVSDQSENVAAKIGEVVLNVIEAVLIVVVVVFLVVGFRTSFVMAANIPIVVLMSIGFISLFGVQLEQISLAALIISLGLLVDNAVQVCDQARTNQIAGMDPFPAAIEGANTLAIPMLVGTLTTMAAFVPMLISLEGGGKEYVYSLPVTVSTTLALSWVLAMSLCVILAGLFIRTPKVDQPASPVVRLAMRLASMFRKRKPSVPDKSRQDEPFLFRIYQFSGMLALRFKWITLLGTLALLVFIMSLPVSSEFFPDANRDQFAVKIHLPETATIEQTDEIARQVEFVIQQLSPVREGEVSFNGKQERLRAMRTLVGGGGSRWHLAWAPEPPSRNFAEILVRTTDGRFTSDFAHRLRVVCERGDADLGIDPVVGARIVPVKLALGPPADPLVFRVTGSGFADPAILRQAANRLKRIVNKQPETWNVHDSWGVDGYQILVNVNEDRATLAGVTNAQVAKTLNSYYSGLQLTTFREDDHLVPIYFKLRPQETRSIRELQESFVEGDNGKIPLSSLAGFKFSWEPARIERRDMNRVIKVSAQMEPGVTGNDVVNRVLQLDEFKRLEASLPVGFHIETGGSYEESQDAGGQMMMSFAISFLLIVMCLIVQYNGWSKPLIILATLPMALAGAWLGLFLSGNSLGFMPQLGILALFGIVLNTAIIFIEFADILISERVESSDGSGPISGIDRDSFRRCLLEAGKQRMLPIFLTTATTVGGLLPLALSGGPLWAGLAWCMIAGLMLTTVLTLYLIPAFYAILVETFGVKPIHRST
ncbi:efflux RND transporter permease subunit [Stieleria sp. JC731]|uniref:efflux RND transporter permease subunit n=1 Tax=Pirellulaceae TaxID=2691357 RepID=UPI001E29D287|nr:efflux RND transporter permease subunit [Stieleria sp. JC731]MCC9600884.1 efflux RND transporter permease subunit [Stieleria sp. JC731]